MILRTIMPSGPNGPYAELPERALSIRQPWAWAILSAGKDIENRPRPFNYRGLICIHASTAPLPPEEIAYSYCVEDGQSERDALRALAEEGDT